MELEAIYANQALSKQKAELQHSVAELKAQVEGWNKKLVTLNLDSDIQRLTKAKNSTQELIDDLRKKFDEAQKKYVKTLEETDALTIGIKKKENEIQEARQGIVNQERELKDRERQLDLKQQKYNERADVLNHDISVHTEKFKKLDRDQKELNVRIDGATQLEKELSEKKENLDIRERSLDQRLADIKKLEQEMDKREISLKEKQANLENELGITKKERKEFELLRGKLEADYREMVELQTKRNGKVIHDIQVEKDELKARELKIIDSEKFIADQFKTIQSKKDDIKILESKNKK
jgi:peptidoglycan hydrolase CwlO-like protein